LDHQNNYIRYLSVDDNAAKSFNIPSISLNDSNVCFYVGMAFIVSSLLWCHL